MPRRGSPQPRRRPRTAEGRTALPRRGPVVSTSSSLLTTLLDQFSHERGPAGLMAGPEPSATVATSTTLNVVGSPPRRLRIAGSSRPLN